MMQQLFLKKSGLLWGLAHLLITVTCVQCLVSGGAVAADRFSASPFGSAVAACRASAGSPREPTTGNQVLILNDGSDALLVRIHLIRQARSSIDLQTFIWTNDECGRLMMYELIQAAQRGVKVRIIADHFVSDKDPHVVAFLATVHPNLQVKHYRPAGKRIKPPRHQVILGALFNFKGFNQRMHNKVMLFDRSIAITGGRNIENSYYSRSTGMTFKDRDVLVLGPVVVRICHSFEKFWSYKHSVPSAELRDVAKVIAANSFRRYRSKADFAFNALLADVDREADMNNVIEAKFAGRLRPAHRVEFLADSPGKNRSFGLKGEGGMTKRMRKIVGSAQHDLIIQSPYLILSHKAVRLFRKLHKKRPQLKVSISTNSFGSTDNVVAYSANYRLRSTYVDQLGWHIYEYKPLPGDLLKVFPMYPRLKALAQQEDKVGTATKRPFLCIHAKSFVLDDRIAFIGSYNLDPRSGNLNTEVGLLIEDAAVARELKNDIRNDIAPRNSWVINRRKMPLGVKEANALLEGAMSKVPIDLWPIRNTSSFELIPGRKPVPPDHPAFHTSYKDLGPFPGAPPSLSTKEITIRLYKAVGGIATPLF